MKYTVSVSPYLALGYLDYLGGKVDQNLSEVEHELQKAESNAAFDEDSVEKKSYLEGGKKQLTEIKERHSQLRKLIEGNVGSVRVEFDT